MDELKRRLVAKLDEIHDWAYDSPFHVYSNDLEAILKLDDELADLHHELKVAIDAYTSKNESIFIQRAKKVAERHKEALEAIAESGD